MTPKEAKVHRITQIKGFLVSMACCAIIALTVFASIDKRMTEPSIELPMFKEYRSKPEGMTKTEFKSLQWLSTDAFPLYKLVSNMTINIDKAFKVNNLTLIPTQISCDTTTSEIDCLGKPSKTAGGPSFYDNTGKDRLTLNYVG